MNVVIFASDNKGVSSLNSVMQEANNAGINLWVMINQDTQLKHPLHNKKSYQFFTNCDNIDPIYSNTLGMQIPFKPDWLIINRERWEPESSIIMEFKTKFNSKIGLVEPNAWILNGAESRLETYSRNRFVPYIDVFFIGSQHGIDQQKLAGFKGNLVAVGNPKYDLNFELEEKNFNYLKDYYKVEETKNKYLFFSLINNQRPQINKIFKSYDLNPNIQSFYKPYPGEPFGSKFLNEFKPTFFLPNTKPILDESHVWAMFEICDTHVGIISSIVHATLLKGKKYIDHSLDLNLPEKYLDFSNVFKDKGPGIENNKSMWMRSFNFTNESQLHDLLSEEYKNKIKTSNNKVWNNLDNPAKLLTLFDDYNDKQAGKRIINYILNDEK